MKKGTQIKYLHHFLFSNIPHNLRSLGICSFPPKSNSLHFAKLFNSQFTHKEDTTNEPLMFLLHTACSPPSRPSARTSNSPPAGDCRRFLTPLCTLRIVFSPLTCSSVRGCVPLVLQCNYIMRAFFRFFLFCSLGAISLSRHKNYIPVLVSSEVHGGKGRGGVAGAEGLVQTMVASDLVPVM